MLQGYSQLIFEGALVTLELALSSLWLAVVIGLIAAGADAADFLRSANRAE